MSRKERLKKVSADVLTLWIADVQQLIREYRDGTHYSANCQHCTRALMLHRDSKTGRCTSCIWWTMCENSCAAVARSYGLPIQAYGSSNKRHNKKVHIARCNRWLKLLNKELERRHVCE